MAVEEVSLPNYHLVDQFKTQSKDNLSELARQFDAVFLQSKLKCNDLEQHFIKEISPLPSKPQEATPHVFSEKISAEINSPIPALSIVNDAEKSTNGTSTSSDDFIKKLWPYAQQAASLIGLDPKILMAQAALETGWGRFIAKDADGASSNNLFNIKARNSEQALSIKTTEFIDEMPVKITASFKKYPSVADSFRDYISLIKESPRYQVALAKANDPQQYTQALQVAGYATDPNYASKILSIYHSDELQHALERNGF